MTDAAGFLASLPAAPSAASDDAAARLRRLAPAVAVALAVFLLLVVASSKLLNDPDTQWHVATGRWIWSHGRVPTSDVFSHTFAGAPWIAKEWLSQLILFAAQAAGGWRGVALVAAAAIAAAYGMLFAWLARRLKPSVALALTLVAVMVAAPHLLARPHALVFPVIVLWMTQLVEALERRATPPLWLVPAMVLWTNMHGSFPLGLALAGILAAEGVLARPAGSRMTAVRQWGLFLAAAGAATLVSPYGWTTILVPLRIGGNVAVPFLAEWRPLTLAGGGAFAIGLLVLSLLMLAAEARANLFRIIAVGAVGVLMIRHSRFVDLFAIVDPILIAGSLARHRSLAPEQRPTSPGATLLASLSVAALLALAASIAALMVAPKPNPTVAPEAALRAALAAGVSGPVYNDYDFGGFLIAHDIRTFVDGRSDQLFLGDFLPGLQRALDAKGAQAFAAILARYHVRWALVRRGSPDAAHLAALPGWSRLFQDDGAVVFVAPPDRPGRL